MNKSENSETHNELNSTDLYLTGVPALLWPRTNFPEVLEQRKNRWPAEEEHEESNFV